MAKNKLFQFDLQNKASKFRKDYGYGETDPILLNSFLFKNNILTVYKPLSANLAGMAVKANAQNMFIMVNQNHSIGKQHFTIAHELYHLLIQENFTSQQCVTGLFDRQTDIEEKKADYFAANLLLPELGIYELIPEEERKTKNAVTFETVFKIQQYYQVSVNAVAFRLVNLELVDASFFDRCNQLYKKSFARVLGYDVKLYEKGNADKIIGDYGQIAKQLFTSQKISESYYFELVNAINIDPLSKDESEDE